MVNNTEPRQHYSQRRKITLIDILVNYVGHHLISREKREHTNYALALDKGQMSSSISKGKIHVYFIFTR